MSQKLSETEFKNPKEIVSWMGAMQAQDYHMSKWAIGVRLSDQSEEQVESAIDKGEIIRIHCSSLAAIYNKKTVSDNGIFFPVIVVNGQVEGIWKRNIQKNKVFIDPIFFKQPNKHIRHLLQQKINHFGKFLNREIVIRNSGEWRCSGMAF